MISISCLHLSNKMIIIIYIKIRSKTRILRNIRLVNNFQGNYMKNLLMYSIKIKQTNKKLLNIIMILILLMINYCPKKI